MESPSNKDRIIAALLTFLSVLAILLLLFIGGLTPTKEDLAKFSTPEIMQPEASEFYEPEFMGAGGLYGVGNGAELNPEFQSPENPVPESGISAQPEAYTRTAKPDSNLSSFMNAADRLAGEFAGFDSNTNRRENRNKESTGVARGIKGECEGRTLLKCSKPNVDVNKFAEVRVAVTVDAAGKVNYAYAKESTDRNLMRECEEAAYNAQWSAKKDARPAPGYIIFTFNP